MRTDFANSTAEQVTPGRRPRADWRSVVGGDHLPQHPGPPNRPTSGMGTFNVLLHRHSGTRSAICWCAGGRHRAAPGPAGHGKSTSDVPASSAPLGPLGGAVGGVSISLVGVAGHSGTTWDSWHYAFWHLARPILGAVFGTISVLIVTLIVKSVATGPSAEPPTVQQTAILTAIAFVVGYREKTLRTLLQRVVDVVLGPGSLDRTAFATFVPSLIEFGDVNRADGPQVRIHLFNGSTNTLRVAPGRSPAATQRSASLRSRPPIWQRCRPLKLRSAGLLPKLGRSAPSSRRASPAARPGSASPVTRRKPWAPAHPVWSSVTRHWPTRRWHVCPIRGDQVRDPGPIDMEWTRKEST